MPIVGAPVVRNGVALCRLHHAAFDRCLIGIKPDCIVEVRSDVLDETDGPMLIHGLQGFHGSTLFVPRSVAQRPDRDLLEDVTSSSCGPGSDQDRRPQPLDPQAPAPVERLSSAECPKTLFQQASPSLATDVGQQESRQRLDEVRVVEKRADLRGDVGTNLWVGATQPRRRLSGDHPRA